MEALADAQRFGALLIAAQSYLASGADPAGLSPISASTLGYLPAAWLPLPARASDYRLYMRAEPDSLITVGLLGSPAALRPLIDRYGVYARRILLSSRSRRKDNSSDAAAVYYYTLMMSFDRQGLDHAAALALSEPPWLDLDSKSHLNSSASAVDANLSATSTPH
jgi:hypothetical protein